MLEASRTDWSIDVIEINRNLPEAAQLFSDQTGLKLNDPHLNIILDDGFRYFERLPQKAALAYNAIVIDLAWMQNMNITHLFSKEMYQNVRDHLLPSGTLVLWTEENSPFSKVSQITYRTLRSVFNTVRVSLAGVDGMVVFYASPGDATGMDALLSDEMKRLTRWLEVASVEAPINRLDDLALNRAKFTIWGGYRPWAAFENGN